jgi:hypothetical protein
MTRRELVHTAIGAIAGVLVASGAWSLQRPARPRATVDPSLADGGGDDIEALRSANAHLVDSLHDADETIAQDVSGNELGESRAAQDPMPPG